MANPEFEAIHVRKETKKKLALMRVHPDETWDSLIKRLAGVIPEKMPSKERKKHSARIGKELMKSPKWKKLIEAQVEK